ncbi:MAG: DUF748 domain-containing protein, partial [Candidatus Omnitrophica bacterium]|nr:DUF748 domain-containing protein [Candidatus Omnitrophota bacterium]
MKKIIEILILVALILSIFYGLALIYLQINGRGIIKETLRSYTGADVKIGRFNIRPLFNLEISNLNIENTGKVQRIFISPSLLSGRLTLNKILIEGLQLNYKRLPPAVVGEQIPVGKVEVTPQDLQGKGRAGFIIKHLQIRDGKINFVDYTVSPEGLKIAVKDLNFNLSNVYFLPVSQIASFELNANIPWQKGKQEGKIEAQGWLNLYKKDMQVTLKISDIDGIYLYPYYSKWVDLEKARIESAKLNFTSNIRGL